MTPTPPSRDPIRFEPNAATPRRWLAVCPAYRATPIHTLILDGPRPLLVKDETERMGLGSFKALGGVYAVARLIERRVRAARDGADPGQAAPIEDPAEILDFTAPEVRAEAARLTFVCASAGNHGLSVAAGARIFGAKARIHIAETVPEGFAARLADQGAEVARSGVDYEASLAAAEADAAETGAQLLADGSWVGHTEPPSLVMEGYTVIAEEMRATFEASGGWPSCVYLQAGVGGLAAAMAHMIRLNWAEQPRITVVEPEAAPCLKESVAAGRPLRVEGPVSAMGRLDCKEPSLLAFETLSRCADGFALISEAEAENAVATAERFGLRTTPSGAAGLAAALREREVRPLIILSEGAV